MLRNFVVLFLIACRVDTSQGVDMVVAPGFTSAQSEAMHEAVKLLNLALGCEAIRWRDGVCKSGENCVRSVSPEALNPGESNHNTTVGADTSFGAPITTIRVDSTLHPMIIRPMVLHEIGHVFGLEHSHGIMAATIPEYYSDRDAWRFAVGVLAGQIEAAGFSCGALPETLMLEKAI